MAGLTGIKEFFAQVWLTAVWFNGRKQMGPACAPVGAVINYGGSMAMAA